MTDERIAARQIHPHETQEYVLLHRARDVLRAIQDVLGHYTRPEDDTTVKDLEYDIDAYLTTQAQRRR